MRQFFGALSSSGSAHEDTLPAVERCTLRPDTLSAYWEAVAASLADAVRTALPSPERGPWPPTAAECLDANLLAQAVGNLVAYRLLASSATPQDRLSRGVGVSARLHLGKQLSGEASESLGRRGRQSGRQRLRNPPRHKQTQQRMEAAVKTRVWRGNLESFDGGRLRLPGHG